VIRIFAILLIALLAILAGGSAYLVGSTRGAATLIAVAGGYLPGQLTVEGEEGSLWSGLGASRVDYRQDDVRIIATGIDLDIDLRRLVQGAVAIERAHVESLRIDETPIDADVLLQGTVGLSPTIPIEAAVEWVDAPTGIRGRGDFDGTLARLDFTHTVEFPDALHATGTISDIVTAPAISAQLSWRQLTLPEQTFGTLVSRQGEADVEASQAAYRVTATTELVRDETQRASISLRAHGDTERLVIDGLDIDGLGGEFQAEGSVVFGDPPVVALKAVGRDFDPGVLLPGYGGRLSFDANIDARWPERLVINLPRLEGEFRGAPLSGSAEVLAADGVLDRASARLSSGPNRINVNVTGQPNLAGAFEIDAPELASLWPGLSGEMRGSGSLTGTRDAPRVSADVTGIDVAFQGQSVERLRVVGKADIDAGVDFVARADGVHVGEQMLGNLLIEGSGTIAAHSLDVGLSGGPVETNFNVDGSWDGTILAERVGEANIDTEIGAWRLRELLAVSVRDDSVEVSGHCWDSDPASICIDAFEFREGRLVAGAELKRFPLQAFGVWIGDEISVEGEANAKLSFERDGEAFRAVVDWKQADTQIAFKSEIDDMLVDDEIDTRLSSLELRLVADNQSAELSGAVVGSFGLEAGVEARLESPLEPDGALSGRLTAKVPDIGELRAFVDRYVPTEELRGALLVDARVGGTRDAPMLDGGARLQDAAAHIPLFGITVEDVDVVVSAGDDDGLVVAGSARSGEGVVELSGRIGVSEDTGLFADIALKGDRFQLVRLPDQSAWVSPDLTAYFDGDRVEFDGRILVPEAAFQLLELGDSAVDTSDDVVVHREGAGPGDARAYSRVAGQVDIALGDDVTFAGAGLSTRLTGGLLLTLRPGAPPAGEGAFQLVDGTFDAFGREMLVERGSLNFYGPLDDPVVDARATRRFMYEARDITLGILLSGRVSEQLDFTLFSEPAMSEADILSFMLVGRPTSTGEAGDGAMSGAALALGLQSLTSRRGASENLTLDEISFEGGGSGDTSVVAGKRLGERWYIRYTYGLFSRVGTFIIRYDIGRGVSIEAGSGAAQSLDLIYSIDR